MTAPQSVALTDQFPALSRLTADLIQRTGASDSSGNEGFVMSVMEGILNAETFDDVFAAQESTMLSGKDFADRPFIILRTEDIEWRNSSEANVAQGGFPFYAIIKLVTLDTQEELSINCGGKTFVAVLHKLASMGYFGGEQPNPLVIKSVASPNGAYLQLLPYKVVTVDAAVTKRNKG